MSLVVVSMCSRDGKLGPQVPKAAAVTSDILEFPDSPFGTAEILWPSIGGDLVWPVNRVPKGCRLRETATCAGRPGDASLAGIASRVAGVISNWTGRWVLCFSTTARGATCSP